MNIDHTPKELAEAIKLAHSLNLEIKVVKYPYSTRIIILGLPVGCGYGVVQVRMAKSHRRHVKMGQHLGARWLYGNLAYTTFYYEISNDPWTIAQAEKLSCSVMKKIAPKAEYAVCTQAQKDWYDNEIMKRNK